jgi:hypothetical protein
VNSWLLDYVSQRGVFVRYFKTTLPRGKHFSRQLQVAEEESMEGPQPVTLVDVLQALRAIGAATDPARSAPTKQGEARK